MILILIILGAQIIFQFAVARGKLVYFPNDLTGKRKRLLLPTSEEKSYSARHQPMKQPAVNLGYLANAQTIIW
jgi:hypothetical protein